MITLISWIIWRINLDWVNHNFQYAIDTGRWIIARKPDFALTITTDYIIIMAILTIILIVMINKTYKNIASSQKTES